MNRQIKLTEKTINDQLKPTPETQFLLSIPGIRYIAAATIFLETANIERFPDDKHFVSYCRLVPGSKDSGGKRRHKSSNKDGNRYLKYVCTEFSIRAIFHYPQIKTFYNRKLRKTNPKVASTIVAKELARIANFVLKKEEPFKSFKGIDVPKAKAGRVWQTRKQS